MYLPEIREKIGELNISGEKLEGNLSLNDFPNLRKLICSENRLTGLDLTNCEQLEELYCDGNQLINLNFTVPNPRKLTRLVVANNNFSSQDLAIFVSFVNL